MKTTITATIDPELLERAKHLRINISGALNEYLAALIARHNQDIGGINIELEHLKLEKLLKKIGNLQVEVKICENNIQKWEELQSKKKEVRLNKEKELRESQSKCMNCGNPIQHKFHKFKVGNVCNACFMTSTSEDIEKWNKK